MFQRKLFAVSALTALLAFPASAEVQWSGFANIGAGFTSGSDEELLGYNDDLGFKPDTLFALQGTSQISDRLTATVQVMGRAENDFDLELEWGYLQYRLNDSWTLNAGQLRLPTYSYSDSIDVGYTYHWVRPPASVYRVPFDTYMGASLTNSTFVGSASVNTQFVAGRFNGDINFGGSEVEADVKNILGANVTAYIGNFTVRGGYMMSDSVTLATQDPQLLGLVQVLGAYGVPEVGDALLPTDDEGTFLGFGLMYDNFDWFIGGEFTQLEVKDSLVSEQQSQYITAGKRFGKVTLHVTFEQTQDDRATPDALLPAASPVAPQIPGLPSYAALAPTVAAVAASQVSEIDYTTVGMRYDFDTGVAFKLDVTTAEDNVLNTDATLVTFAIQTVF
ncbi:MULTISPECIES: hypothetical protein [Gammaproteobacteria]|uniref:hypothetical protein n=1 Tax=Gammaproteobacteria TaxID=1236 RepID=UPI000DD0AD52|nr:MULTISPECIES: hypothetical protein [Gammaproteobacteria]RTE86031.1 hypothetical protein DQX04_05520 [Aliidiomarina sp. B3213]TCZ91385.1 hypothetical protein EYQ95_05530 [Lysobacter sp. N42]